MNKTTVCLSLLLVLTLASGVADAKCIESTNSISGTTTYCDYEHDMKQEFSKLVVPFFGVVLALLILKSAGS